MSEKGVLRDRRSSCDRFCRSRTFFMILILYKFVFVFLFNYIYISYFSIFKIDRGDLNLRHTVSTFRSTLSKLMLVDLCGFVDCISMLTPSGCLPNVLLSMSAESHSQPFTPSSHPHRFAVRSYASGAVRCVYVIFPSSVKIDEQSK